MAGQYGYAPLKRHLVAMYTAGYDTVLEILSCFINTPQNKQNIKQYTLYMGIQLQKHVYQ